MIAKLLIVSLALNIAQIYPTNSRILHLGTLSSTDLGNRHTTSEQESYLGEQLKSTVRPNYRNPKQILGLCQPFARPLTPSRYLKNITSAGNFTVHHCGGICLDNEHYGKVNFSQHAEIVLRYERTNPEKWNKLPEPFCTAISYKPVTLKFFYQGKEKTFTYTDLDAETCGCR